MAGPTVHHFRLANGVRFVLASLPAMPAIAVNVRVAVGSRHERPGRTGLAHLFEHLMFAATRNLPTGEHVKVIEQLGGYTNAVTLTESTSYFETIPPGVLDRVLEMENTRLALLPQAIDEEVLSTQRNVVKNERRQAVETTPYGDAPELLAAAMFPAPHPYHHTPTGSMADIGAATLDDVRCFFGDHYVSAATLVAVAGPIEPGPASELAERAFGRLAPAASAPAAPAAPSPPAELIRLERRTDHPQNLLIAHRLPGLRTRECAAAELLAHLLAGGRASRLERRLKHALGLAANISFTVRPMFDGDSTALARLRPQPRVDPAALEEAYLSELARIADSGPEPAEADRARSQWLAAWLTGIETVRGRAEELTRQWLAFDRPPRLGRMRDRIEAVTVDDLQKCAKALLADRRVTLVYRERS